MIGSNRVFSAQALAWRGNDLHLGRGGKLVSIVSDAKYPGIWRVQYPDGRLTDMVNRTRVKDAALSIARAILKGEETPSDQALVA
jgi:hypothetical protein